ncbi:uncharacterized protein MAM_06040 [Metarhizium album ARSEF 1941]|uniref:DUF4419 domain-containing protein n=1 Tax=Metarhizium album (strain ARSEF 1941) TaxID=1081103 RepID=A0A0B2WRR5_METAS|nr:uncharacterized protein MAM_06040 [Metarhizium album ARSEF 1941]KHN96192.1 hypothetical protein MAM_06040 [Metarhizium album ARSEF 1941]
MKGLLSLLPITTVVFGQITVKVSDVEPLPLSSAGFVASADELFRQSCPEEVANKNPYTSKLLLSSHSKFEEPSEHVFQGDVYPSSDSFVRGAIAAWAQHQSLVLRPDVIWFEILTQLNFYMTKHAEDIRHLFVNFEGKKEIVVEEISWTKVIGAFAAEIQQRVKTSWLLGWITPGFSTSTQNDNMTATVLMMGLMQHYFQFTGTIICGLPSVTLLGTKPDWVRLLKKLDRLPEFGDEPAQYAHNLRPIFSRFVQTWDEPDDPQIKKFWSQIVRANKVFSCGAGPTEYDVSGWITGFLHWREDGALVAPNGTRAQSDDVRLDDVAYTHVDTKHIPVGYAKAPLKMLHYPVYWEDTQAYVLAGNIGIKRTISEPLAKGGKPQVLAEAMNSWFLYGPVNTNFTTGPKYGNLSEFGSVAASLSDWCPAADAK